MSKSRKNSILILIALLLGIDVAHAETREVALDVPGMNCSLCPVTVKKALQRVPGFIDAQISLDTKRAVVRYDADKVTPEALAKAVTQIGYPASIVQK